MKFAIGELEYFNSLGYDTMNWRKSLDGSKALVHYDFAAVLCDDNMLEIYSHDDEDFKDLLAGIEWTEQVEEIEE